MPAAAATTFVKSLTTPYLFLVLSTVTMFVGRR